MSPVFLLLEKELRELEAVTQATPHEAAFCADMLPRLRLACTQLLMPPPPGADYSKPLVG